MRCLSCGAPLGGSHLICPRCGAVQPQKRLGSTLGLAVLIAVLALYTIYAIVLGGR